MIFAQNSSTHCLFSPHRLPFSFVNEEVAKATCLCLLEEASHASMVKIPDGLENHFFVEHTM